ncbi:MAG TPA: c-type cytochrome [Myxococcales bacterium]
MRPIVTILGVAAALAAGPAAAAGMGGQEVVETQCKACHGGGKDGAPRIGDAAAWSKRTNLGLSGLTQHALDGVRKMPAHGGKMDLTDLEIKRAVTYMVNQSGGKWAEPIDRANPPKSQSAEKIVKEKCAACHAEGKNGAPRIGDKDAWVKRAQPGFDSLVRSAIQGHGGMPARGGFASLTDEEMRGAVTYMFQTSTRGK